MNTLKNVLVKITKLKNSRRKVVKSNLRIISKAHVHIQTINKAHICMSFQNNQHKIVGEGVHTSIILYIDSIKALNSSQTYKINVRIIYKPHIHILGSWQTFTVKSQKRSA